MYIYDYDNNLLNYSVFILYKYHETNYIINMEK